jgi:glyoxylase-like metal-dependent hydrolase (beta-lactamase superfamily II)
MNFHRIENDLFRSNCYVLWDENRGAILIDPGSRDLSTIRRFLRDHSLTPEFIILTHEHFDHIFGCADLKLSFGCRTICSKTCGMNVADAKRNYSAFYGDIIEIKKVDVFVEDLNFSLNLSSMNLQFLLTPGHSPGGISIQIGRYLFSGDTIMKNMRTFIRLPESDRNLLKKSIDIIYRQVPGTTIVMPGHGEMFPLQEMSPDVILGSARSIGQSDF